MAPPVDPHLPTRLRRLSFIRRAETAISNAWFRTLTRWLDTIRPPVLAPYRDSNGTLPPQPSLLITQTGAWEQHIAQDVMPTIRNTAHYPYTQITTTNQATFDRDAHIQQYLTQAQNRLSNVPAEVYARITTQVERRLRNGTPIPDIARDIEQTLTATGTPLWQNRATTVARTEAIGATNAGAYAGAIAAARELEDDKPMKVWLATEDSRTRPTHRTADGQQRPLNEPFTVGGFDLLFPGDPTGPPQEVINCRCTLLDIIAGETIDWTDRQFQEDPWAGYDETED